RWCAAGLSGSHWPSRKFLSLPEALISVLPRNSACCRKHPGKFLNTLLHKDDEISNPDLLTIEESSKSKVDRFWI
ncbi:MAG: hypothetical protein WBO98_06710, partial [Candidatus Nitrotoga sp.]